MDPEPAYDESGRRQPYGGRHEALVLEGRDGLNAFDIWSAKRPRDHASAASLACAVSFADTASACRSTASSGRRSRAKSGCPLRPSWPGGGRRPAPSPRGGSGSLTKINLPLRLASPAGCEMDGR